MASEETIRQAGETLCRPVGRMVPKGRSAALKVFEPLSEAEAADGWFEEYRRAFDAIEKDPAEARSALQALALPRPNDLPGSPHARHRQHSCRVDGEVMQQTGQAETWSTPETGNSDAASLLRLFEHAGKPCKALAAPHAARPTSTSAGPAPSPRSASLLAARLNTMAPAHAAA